MFQFPANPLVGQLFTPIPGVVYKFNGTGWAPFTNISPGRFPDGTVGLPGISWVNDTASGWYRAGVNDYRYSVNAVDELMVNQLGVVTPNNLHVGSVTAGSLTPPVIVADQNDYNPAGMGNVSFFRLVASVPVNITGLVQTVPGASGRLMTIHNVGVVTITLVGQSALSLAANRFSFLANVPIPPQATVLLQYDAADQRWRLVGASPASAVPLSIFRPKNFFINGLCRVGQRGSANNWAPGTTARGTVDRIFGYHTNASAISIAQADYGAQAPIATSGYGAYLQFTTPAAGSVSMATRLESRDTRQLAGSPVTFSVKACNAGGGAGVNATLFVYRANAVDNFAGVTQIFASAPVLLPDVASGNLSALASFTFTPTAVDCQNGLQFALTVAYPAAVAGPFLVAGDWQITKTDYVAPIEETSLAEDIDKCQRYFSKSYDLDAPPGTVTSVGIVTLASGSASPSGNIATFTFPTRMRVSPVITLYNNNTGALNLWDNNIGGANSVSTFLGGQSGLNVIINDVLNVGGLCFGHWTANAEL